MPSAADGGREAAADRVFRRLLVNTLVSGVTSSFLWFALTFWVYLETRSVVATAVIAAAFSLASAVIAPAYGTYVDHHPKRSAMVLASAAMTGFYAIATLLFLAFEPDELLSLRHPWFWLFVGASLVGSVAGSLRSIALSTCVTLLVPEHRRDKANGRVGTVSGISFAVTSVFSGLVVGNLGMGWAMYLSTGAAAIALVHVTTLQIDAASLVESDDLTDGRPTEDTERRSLYDVRGGIAAVRAVPGLPLLIGLAAVNNLLGGVFMALMDPYGLELVSVQTWGLLWGGISFAMIGGGLYVSRYGLGSNPLRVVVGGNLVNWVVCSTFTLQSSIVPLTIGMCVWLALMPAIEAAEQTVLQARIPADRQGRVFGLAQLIENSASPVTSLLIGPLADAVVMPSMTDGAGARAIGSWFGTGPERGLALIFTVSGLVGIVVTLTARASRSYRVLSASGPIGAGAPPSST